MARLKNPMSDPTSLGRLLTEAKLVTDKQLNDALLFQRNNVDLFLGEILVRMGFLFKGVLEVALLQQELLRKGASKQSSNRVRKALRLATQQAKATSETGTTLTQILQNLAAKLELK